MTVVPDFSRTLLKPLGAPSGKVETFIEVPFTVGERSIRPDGIIAVTRAGKTWGAIVEAKTGPNALEPDQMNAYLDLAREIGADAVLSLSNHFVTAASGYPIEVDRRKLRKVSLAHWSWVNVLTEAVVVREHRGVSDPEQAYVLGELIRYLSDPRSGAVAFDSMGPAWTKVRDGARARTIRRSEPEVDAVAARWDDLIRFLALELTKDLGRNVKQLLPKREAQPAARRSALCESLESTGVLYAELSVPDAAGALSIAADLFARQVSVSTAVEAPRDGRSKGRVSWLLRQLGDAPEGLRIEARVARTQSTLATTLGEAHAEPGALYPESDKEIRSFLIAMTTPMGLKRSAGRGSFIDSVLDTTKTFYADVLQALRAWKPPPPKMKKPSPEEESQVPADEAANRLPPPDIARPAPEESGAPTDV
ncbi:MAG: hypothetical protein WD004_04885 [Actinomycetota bacterium]